MVHLLAEISYIGSLKMGKHTVIRYHDFCAGHTVTGHESKCKHLHGHNYRVHFHVRAVPLMPLSTADDLLDDVGRVIDFSVVKQLLCNWLEHQWDHKFLINKDDPRLAQLLEADHGSLVICNFNPTAENMAQYLVEVVGPAALEATDVELFGVELEETRKCSVSYFLD
ncbi:6-carboxy-5,6,7,8-tetrahydropterin synthase [Vibrio phage vB_VpaS_CHI]|nr:6-carboxy-5,6,7,8-tetrahydropterin synthase [Vibrio phage vB_VpaS_ALK]USL90107.1 6-carboxy-5,6,7,8-tetrahydropterin synthase [Vibrio phage vB_VpaS_CHI]